MHRQQTRAPAVLDASFWINAVRMGVVTYLTDYFELKAPPRVVDELTVQLGHSPPPETSTIFANWQQRQVIATVAPQQALDRFEPGENEAIALARERGWTLLVDNSAPRDWSRGVAGLRVVDSPAFVIVLYDQGRLDHAAVTAALARCQAARRVVREALLVLAELARRKEGAEQ